MFRREIQISNHEKHMFSVKFRVFKSGYLSNFQLISIYKFTNLCVCYLWNVKNKMFSDDFHAFTSVRQHKKGCFKIIFKVQKSFQVRQSPFWTCENRRKTAWQCLCLSGYPRYFLWYKITFFICPPSRRHFRPIKISPHMVCTSVVQTIIGSIRTIAWENSGNNGPRVTKMDSFRPNL